MTPMTVPIMVGPTPVPVTAPPAVEDEDGDKGIGSVVDVEQRALRAFEHDLFAVFDGLVEQLRRCR